MGASSVFISYSHHDEEWAKGLDRKLYILGRENRLEVWSDRQIETGDNWEEEIAHRLSSAAVAVLLISDNFLLSQFIQENELPAILRASSTRGLRVFPVLLSDTPYQNESWLSSLQLYPRGRCLDEGDAAQRNRDLTNIANEIARFCVPPRGTDSVSTTEFGKVVKKPVAEFSAAQAVDRLDKGSYVDLSIDLSHHERNQYDVEMRLSQSGPHSHNKVARGIVEIEPKASWTHATSPVGYGRSLAGVLFGKDRFREVLRAARAASEHVAAPYRIRLGFAPSARDLTRLPWETMTDPDLERPFVELNDVLLTRAIVDPVGEWPEVLVSRRNPWRILDCTFVPGDFKGVPGLEGLAPSSLPNPSVCPPLSLEEGLVHQVVTHTIPALRDRLSAGVDVLILRAFALENGGSPAILCQSQSGNEIERLNTGSLLGVFSGLLEPPQIVVLSPLFSGEGVSLGEPLAHFAPAFAERGVSAVLAAQATIQSDSWTLFASTLLSEAAQHGRLDVAAKSARRQVLPRPDWWAPVVSTRSRKSRLQALPAPSIRRLSDDKWHALLENIRDGRCTPIIGDGVSLEISRAKSEVARRLALKNHFPLARHERASLSQVAQYLSADSDRDFIGVRREFRNELRSFLEEHAEEAGHRPAGPATPDALLRELMDQRYTSETPNPFSILANLPLPLFLTTHQTGLLTRALREGGKRPVAQSFPIFEDRRGGTRRTKKRPNSAEPLVYHLFGQLDELDSLLLTEDDHFDFLTAFATRRSMMPSIVGSALTNSSLLFLGYQLQDWSFRVLLRSITALEGGAMLKKHSHVAVQLDPDGDNILDPERARRFFESRLSSWKVDVFWTTPSEFLEELHRRWGAHQ